MPRTDIASAVLAGPCFVAWANLKWPTALRGSRPVYGARLRCPLMGPHAIPWTQLQGALSAAGRERWDDFDALIKANAVRLPWMRDRDGRDTISFNAVTPEMPHVLDKDRRPLDPGAVTLGSTVRVLVEPSTWISKAPAGNSTAGRGGLAFKLIALQLLHAGPPSPSFAMVASRFTEPSSEPWI